jgi:hypothetical protein
MLQNPAAPRRSAYPPNDTQYPLFARLHDPVTVRTAPPSTYRVHAVWVKLTAT